VCSGKVFHHFPFLEASFFETTSQKLFFYKFTNIILPPFVFNSQTHSHSLLHTHTHTLSLSLSLSHPDYLLFISRSLSVSLTLSIFISRSRYLAFSLSSHFLNLSHTFFLLSFSFYRYISVDFFLSVHHFYLSHFSPFCLLFPFSFKFSSFLPHIILITLSFFRFLLSCSFFLFYSVVLCLSLVLIIYNSHIPYLSLLSLISVSPSLLSPSFPPFLSLA
jgi:hypothetical protein